MAGLMDFLQSASNSAASNVSAPVDGLAWLLRKAGVPMPQNPMMGSDWMAQRGFTKPVAQSGASLMGETAGMLAPFLAAAKAPQIAKGLMQGADNLAAPRAMNPQAGKVFVYPQDKALATAQINAAKSLDNGGLGLAANNTPAQRAQAMGFTNDVYHGTNADIFAMNASGKGKTSGAGAFVTDNPLVSETYFSGSGGGNILPLKLRKEGLMDVNARGRNWADIDTNTLAPKAGKKRYSLDELELSRNSATTTDELGSIAGQLGLKGVDIKNVKDMGPNSHIFRAKEYLSDKYGVYPNDEWSNVSGKQFTEARDYLGKMYDKQKSNVTAVQDPSMLRSRFAAFDPARRNEADILGRADPELLKLIAGGLLGYGGYNAVKD